MLKPQTRVKGAVCYTCTCIQGLKKDIDVLKIQWFIFMLKNTCLSHCRCLAVAMSKKLLYVRLVMSLNSVQLQLLSFADSLQLHAHAIYRDFFSAVKIEKMIFLIRKYIVGTF